MGLPCNEPEFQFLQVTTSEPTLSTTTSSTRSNSLIPIQQLHFPSSTSAAGAVLALQTDINSGGKTKQTHTSL
jgi:hypothetical protein